VMLIAATPEPADDEPDEQPEGTRGGARGEVP
jgi:hypothetical protein